MTFQFKIEDVVEVHRDPLGHYHHWTILGGRLTAGSIWPGNFIKIPLQDGTSFVTHMLDFIVFSRSMGAEVSTGQLDHPFGLMVWRPAPQQSLVALEIAVESTQEDFEHSLLEMLEHYPERIFHNRGAYAPHLDCRECTLEMHNVPQVRKMLEQLQTSTDAYIAQRASRVLQSWATPRPKVDKKAGRRPLFSL